MRSNLHILVVPAALFLLTSACASQIIRNESTDLNAGKLSQTRAMSTKRAAHTATLLDDGKVFIAGGFVGGDGGILSTTELFDPNRNAFVDARRMSVARVGHTATRLRNGKVLIAGGYNGDYLSAAEIYDPDVDKFFPAGGLTVPRSGHIATLLADGRVLIAGGVGSGWTFLRSAEIFDPVRNSFNPTGDMSIARESHTSTPLNNGTVLITGGHTGRRSSITIYTSSEIYDPSKGRFTTTANMTIRRHKHDAVLLRDGRVLILGGSDERDGDGAYKNAEIYDPRTDSFSPIQNHMTTSRYKLQGTAVVLSDGKVLIAGGASRAEVFDPATARFSPVAGDMGTKRLFATATLLRDGQVLIAGGYSDGNTVSSNAWLYRG